MNLWHDIAPGSAQSINTIVEIGKGSKNKYEVDKKTGLIALDRVAHTAQDFPFDYGFVPQTLWEDNDPIDVVILSTYPFLPGVLVRVRPVALLNMIDDGDSDSKIIGVPEGDPRWNDVKDLDDINKHTLKEIEHFYSTYKTLQNKVVRVDGFGNRAAAEAAFLKGIEAYKKAHSKGEQRGSK